LWGFFVGLAVHDDDGAEDEAEGVGDDGGAAGGDASLCDEGDDVGESLVDVLGVVEDGLLVDEDIVPQVGGVVEALVFLARAA
jgi:hypothetical protein